MSTKMLEEASLKAAVAVDQHTLGFYMLAFSKSPDKQGDIIAPQAADEWLKAFYAAGNPLPISFTHSAVTDAGDPFNIIGYAPADAEHVFKDSHGIRVIANLDTASNPTAAQVYTLAKRGIVTGASVAYFTTAAGQTLQDDGSTLITKIEDIIECGPCLDPANEDAFIFAVKAMEALKMKVVDEPTDNDLVLAQLAFVEATVVSMKAGRVISAANLAKLRAANEVINELLAFGEQEIASVEQKANGTGQDPDVGTPQDQGPDAELRRQLAAFIS